MDATWKISVINQVEGNPFLTDTTKDGLLWLLRRTSEEECKSLAYTKNNKGRFFYKLAESSDITENSEFVKKMQDIAKQVINSHASANLFLRKYSEFSKLLTSDGMLGNYATTYRKSGHYYINGARQY